MKKISVILGILTFVVTISISYNKSYADGIDDYVNAIISSVTSKYENINGSNVGQTGTVKHGVVENNQGWLIYGIDAYGNGNVDA